MKYFPGWIKTTPNFIISSKTTLKFKWEWRVEYEENLNRSNFRPPEYEHWVSKNQNYKNRKLARSWYHFIKDCEWCRNVVMKRRLVQVNWEDYNDSFGWNSGCGKK